MKVRFFLIFCTICIAQIVCDTGADPSFSVPKFDLQKELQDIRNQLYHETTMRLHFDKELSAMARRYRTLNVEHTNAKLENLQMKREMVAAYDNLKENCTDQSLELKTILQSLQETINVINQQLTTLNSSLEAIQPVTKEHNDSNMIARGSTSFFRSESLKKMAGNDSDWLMHFRVPFYKCCMGCNKTLPERERKISPTRPHGKANNRGDIKTNSPDGVYTIYPDLRNPVRAYCKMAGFKWTVFQRRLNGATDFYRGWADYRDGFGDASSEFWLGNKNIFLITKGRSCKLRIEMKDWNDKTGFAEYKTFRLGNESDGFRLQVGIFSGNVSDGLRNHNGRRFTTKDKDQDTSSGNCAVLRSGAWWYYGCTASNLNGDYSVRSGSKGVFWLSLYLQKTEMMLRCN